jgi:CheY-like chemotaxis protein
MMVSSRLRRVRKLLERAGYSVLAATDGESGLCLFESNPLDLVLMDYYIPPWRNRNPPADEDRETDHPYRNSEWRNRAS